MGEARECEARTVTGLRGTALYPTAMPAPLLSDCSHWRRHKIDDRVTQLCCRAWRPPDGGWRPAAHLVDHVIPHVPVRQWVLTVPHRFRYRIGYDHALCKRFLRALDRALQAYYRNKTGRLDGQSGSVTFISAVQQQPGAKSAFSPDRPRWCVRRGSCARRGCARSAVHRSRRTEQARCCRDCVGRACPHPC
jgi:hypothetical protein